MTVLTKKLRRQTINLLTSKYEIVDIFDFLHNDANLYSFYHWCEKWKDHILTKNQRLLILNIDTDYYSDITNPIGNNNFNFFRCCSHFKLPTEFLIYFSCTYGMHDEIRRIAKLFNFMPPVVIESIFVTPLAPSENIPNSEFVAEKASKPFISLNKTVRSHRLLFLSLLADNNLIDSFYLSWNLGKSKTLIVDSSNELKNSNFSIPNGFFQTVVPFNRINDLMEYSSSDYQVLAKHAKNFMNQSLDLSRYTNLKNTHINQHHAPALENGLIYVITETVYNYPYPWISEKTTKAILSKRPFIIVGSSGTVKQLRKLGYKTFDSVWDESYDDIIDGSARISAIIKLLLDLNSTNLFALTEKIKEIVDYNFNHYCNNYVNDDRLEWFNI